MVTGMETSFFERDEGLEHHWGVDCLWMEPG